MAILERGQVEQLIKQRPKKDKINAAIIQDSRLRFHTVPSVGNNSWQHVIEQGHSDFITWVSSFLKKKDKIDIFRNVLRPPHDTNELTTEIFKELKISMHAQDRNVSMEYSDPALKLEFDNHRRIYQDDRTFVEEQVFWSVKSAISSFVIIDSMEVGGRIRPYSYLLTADHVIDYQLTNENKVEYLIFITDVDPTIAGNRHQDDYEEGAGSRGRFLAQVDELYYRVYYQENQTLELIREVQHSIGWTPARPVWTEKADDRNELLFNSPISSMLGALDWYLFFSVSKKVIDTYGPWPIISMFTTKCTYRDTEHKVSCDNGWMYYESGKQRCPNCNDSSNLVGAGSVFRVPAPAANNKFTSYTENAVKFVTMKSDILQYITDQRDNLHDTIYRKVVGKDVEATKEQAINEKQVDTGYESRHAVLSNFARNIEKCHKFIIDTTNKVLFGDRYIGSNVSYGNRFFLKTLAQLNTKYKEAKESGASSYELKLQRDFIRHAEYRNNQEDLDKMQLLAEIEPFSEYSLSEVVEMQKMGTAFVSRKDFVLKLNFNKFVQRFERDQLPLNEFGKLAPKARRIARITDILNKYVEDEIKILNEDGQKNNNSEDPGGNSQEGES